MPARAGRSFIYTGVVLLIAASIISVGCRQEGDLDRTVEDDLGRTIHLPDTVERVVTLAPNLTEIVFAAGAGATLVGVGHPDDYPPEVERLPRYSTYPLDFEAVAALDPDLAFGSDQVNGLREAETLGSLGVPTYFLKSSSLREILDSVEDVGQMLDTEAAAERAADSLRARVDSLRALTRAVNRPITLFLIGQETLYSFGRESYMHELIDLAGGRSATVELDAEAPVLSEEFVLSVGPEVIIGPWRDAEDDHAATLLAHHPSWDVLPAIANGRVYGVDPDLVERPGPRLVEGAWAMARHLHPDILDAR